MDEPVALKPCPFCHGGEFRFDESTYWTGQRSELLNVKLRHWCERQPNCPPSTMELVAKTEKEVRELWNNSSDPRVRELVDALRPFARIDIDARGELMPGEYLNWEDWAEDVLRARAAIAAEGLKEAE
jgi:hypothetical protein